MSPPFGFEGDGARRTGGIPAPSLKMIFESYDVSRAFYRVYNPLFVAHWKKGGGRALEIQ